jgi:hypothetical protein
LNPFAYCDQGGQGVGQLPGGGGSVPSGAKFTGFNQAITDLGTPSCAGLIAGTSDQTAQQLIADLNRAQVTTGTSNGNGQVTFTPDGNGNYKSSYQWAYTTGGNIQLNGNYFPDPAQQNVQVPGGTTTSLLNVVNVALGTSLSAAQFGQLVFLHELSHIANGSPKDVIDTDAHNQSIISKCIN